SNQFIAGSRLFAAVEKSFERYPLFVTALHRLVPRALAQRKWDSQVALQVLWLRPEAFLVPAPPVVVPAQSQSSLRAAPLIQPRQPGPPWPKLSAHLTVQQY